MKWISLYRINTKRYSVKCHMSTIIIADLVICACYFFIEYFITKTTTSKTAILKWISIESVHTFERNWIKVRSKNKTETEWTEISLAQIHFQCFSGWYLWIRLYRCRDKKEFFVKPSLTEEKYRFIGVVVQIVKLIPRDNSNFDNWICSHNIFLLT